MVAVVVVSTGAGTGHPCHLPARVLLNDVPGSHFNCTRLASLYTDERYSEKSRNWTTGVLCVVGVSVSAG